MLVLLSAWCAPVCVVSGAHAPRTSKRANVSTSARKPSLTYFVSSAQSKDDERTTQR